MEAFDKRKFLPACPSGPEGELHAINRRTLGLSLFSPSDGPPRPDRPIVNFGDLFKGVFHFFLNAESLFQEEVADNAYRVIAINNRGVGLLEFNLSEERKNMLMDSGRSAAAAFYKEKPFTDG